MADLLRSVIAAHGGLDRWRTVRAIDVVGPEHALLSSLVDYTNLVTGHECEAITDKPGRIAQEAFDPFRRLKSAMRRG